LQSILSESERLRNSIREISNSIGTSNNQLANLNSNVRNRNADTNTITVIDDIFDEW